MAQTARGDGDGRARGPHAAVASGAADQGRPIACSPSDQSLVMTDTASIVRVGRTNVDDAAAVHSASWKDSHRAFCSPDFVEQHTPEHQKRYLLGKIASGSEVFMLVDGEAAGAAGAVSAVGVVSVTGDLIEDLYVLPQKRGRGYGTRLLRHAIAACSGTPTLWILENNERAARLYRRLGFKETGGRHVVPGGIDEVEFGL